VFPTAEVTEIEFTLSPLTMVDASVVKPITLALNSDQRKMSD
jgi:hypothetical protein